MAAEIKIRYWADETQQTCVELLTAMRPFSVYKGFSPDQRGNFADLLTASARSTQSAIFLTREGCVWDAEIVMRSSLESTLKFLYILSDCADMEARLKEYSRDLFDVGLLRNHEKAEEFFASFGKGANSELRPIQGILLSEEELNRLRTKYPRHFRRELERRWGLTGLVNCLARSDLPEARQFPALLHSINMASHIHHADAHGAGIVLERDRRGEDRRALMHLAHAARLLSDAISFTTMRLSAAYRFIANDLGPVEKILSRSVELREQFDVSYSEWIEREYDNKLHASKG